MAIPLAPSAAPAKSTAPQDLVTGNNRTFATGIGDWLNHAYGGGGSGTLSWDSTDTNAWLKQGGSLKVVTLHTDSSAWIELDVDVELKAGEIVECLFAAYQEESPPAINQAYMNVALQTADDSHIAAGPVSAYGPRDPDTNAPPWKLYRLVMPLTADKSGVKLIMRRQTDGTPYTMSLHLGFVRIAKVKPGHVGFGALTAADVLPASIDWGGSSDEVRQPVLVFPSGYNYPLSGGLGRNTDSGLQFVSGSVKVQSEAMPGDSWGAAILGVYSGGEIDLDAEGTDGAINFWAAPSSGSAADLSSDHGCVDVEVGPDWVGFYISEGADGQIQLWADWSSGYDIEFVDVGSGHWKVRDEGATRSKNLIDLQVRRAHATATIASGTTAIVVNHGLSYTPVIDDFVIVPTNNPTNAPGHWWVDAITATQFTIHCAADPGASGMTFSWRIDQ